MNAEERTTVAVKIATYDQLKQLKIHPRETYDQVIQRLIDNYEESDETPGDGGCPTPACPGA